MTTQQYIRDPQNGQLRPVVYVDRHGNRVSPPVGTQTMVAAPPPPIQATPYVPPQAHLYQQPTLPTHTPFLPPGATPQQYQITVKYRMGKQAYGQPSPYGYAAPPRAGVLSNLFWGVLTMAIIAVAAYLWWGILARQGHDPLDIDSVLTWGADAAREAAAQGSSQDAPTAPQTPAAPVAAAMATVPMDLGDLTLQGPPSVSAALIDAYLAEQGSPAQGTGAAWVAKGEEYGIDPVFGIAFFLHESGLGVAQGWAGHKADGGTTHNVGNIICAGYATCHGRFRDYSSWEEGIGDWYRLIAVEYIQGRGHQTVADVIPVYAPSVENDVPRYVAAVQESVIALREQQRLWNEQTGVSGSQDSNPGAPVLWTIETARIRVEVTELATVNGEMRLRGYVTNVVGVPITVPLSAFSLKDATGKPFVADSDVQATLKPGESTPLDLALGQVTGALTMRIELPPDPPVEMPLTANGMGLPGPYAGCPVVPTNGGRVVVTQAYGPTHSGHRRELFGAVDLAVDSDGDGNADPAGSQGQPIVAAHDGEVTVTPNSHPAGNHVWVDDGQGTRTGYSHLDTVTVQSGQYVQAGEQIGTLGSTGQSSGPHLDLQLWVDGVNTDPAPLIAGC